MKEFDIRTNQDVYIGHWAFDPSLGDAPQAKRSAEGFIISLPSRLKIDQLEDKDWQAIVTGLSAEIQLEEDGTELGVALNHCVYRATAKGSYPAGCILEWRGSASALQFLEKRRNGRSPRLRLNCRGQILRTVADPRRALDALVAAPEPFFKQVIIEYPLHLWVKVITDIGEFGNVLVEIPLPGKCDPNWGAVFRSLREARSCLESGGETGWRGSIVAIRTALEGWSEIDKQRFTASGWKPPLRADLELWTKEQRLDAIRWSMHQFCHLAAHQEGHCFVREDAVLALACFSALLGCRNP